MEKVHFVRLIRSAVLILLLVFAAGCNASGKPPAEDKGGVSATGDFVKYFGPAPAADKGTCYAFVIYFPSAKEPGKVLPFPFFSFDEASINKVALGKLIAGVGELKSYDGEMLQPFPAGTRVLDVSRSGDAVTVDFSKDLAAAKLDPKAQRAVANAVALTLRQFPGAAKVVIKVEGAESPLSKLAASADESAVLPLSPPRLLGVTGMKEKGAAGIEEVDAFFDRPVDIKELTLSGADGKRIEGDIYQSVFDMAGVLKTKSPLPLQAGAPIKVRWKITDKLGRRASGDGEVPLEVKEH